MAGGLGLRALKGRFELGLPRVGDEQVSKGMGGQAEGESPLQAGEETEEEAGTMAEGEGYTAGNGAKATPGRDFQATVEDVGEEVEDQACEPGENGQSHQSVSPWPLLLSPAPLDSSGGASELNVAETPAEALAWKYIDSLPVIPVADILHHRDVRARAVYWMNRALLSDPGTKVKIHDVCAVYRTSFAHDNAGTQVEVLDEDQLIDLIFKMFKGISGGVVLNGAGRVVKLLNSLAWQGLPSGAAVAATWHRHEIAQRAGRAGEFDFFGAPVRWNLPTEAALVAARGQRPEGSSERVPAFRAGTPAESSDGHAHARDNRAGMDRALAFLARVKERFADRRPGVYERLCRLLKQTPPGSTREARTEMVGKVRELIAGDAEVVGEFEAWCRSGRAGAGSGERGGGGETTVADAGTPEVMVEGGVGTGAGAGPAPYHLTNSQKAGQTRQAARHTRQLLKKMQANGVLILPARPMNAFQAHLLADPLLALPAGIASPWLQRLRSRGRRRREGGQEGGGGE
ncbi:hypothetical protein LTR54_014865 [Friedmanniomyces endolithicus]|uniref:Uncharacterized protein n=1 Tax=Friedmanniomyces endolithicus TaxID=329885 RepID=A0AAN6JFC0_9PEZI|nr:hypothetical protein LTS00_014403 [Friedmanniomyces endolithicus]KAK0328128.1 hypothetical protein LTR82_000055 [Friedmanniomyces endolithicus]KAK0981800.1 hypothetical protein LTR54_014865 [Friedmanniomyces endolithicus]